MQTKQTIAIIGATGTSGKEVAKNLASGNYRLLLIADKKQELNLLKKEIKQQNPQAEIEPIECSHTACWEADFIIIDLQKNTEKELAEKIRAVVNQKTLIRIHDGNTEHPTSNLQELLPNSKLIHVFTGNGNLHSGREQTVSIWSKFPKSVASAREVLEKAGILSKNSSFRVLEN